jgi:ATPases involved in chromosome partitioning
MTISDIEKILSTVIHPAYDKDIISLGIPEDIKVEEFKEDSKKNYKVKFKLVFKSPDPLSGSIKKACEEAINKVYPDTNIIIMELVREGAKPKKNDIRDLGQEQLNNVGKIIAIASGKGGVGKSTITVNLAIALAKMGYKVGVADADVYGPSIPKMTATEEEVPAAQYTYEDGYTDNGEFAAQMQEAESEKNLQKGHADAYLHGKVTGEIILPIKKYGIEWMSIGYFASPEQALIWRGPMACNALKQMILQVKWGELDYLLIDLPPGTGDIHISLVKDIPLDGAIIVSTPQAVALADVEKGINMYRNPDINKPVLGIVENMAWFTPAELPNNKYYIFGKEGCKNLSAKYNVPILAQIPLIQSIRESGDNGMPAALAIKAYVSPDPTNVSNIVADSRADAFETLAKELLKK